MYTSRVPRVQVVWDESDAKSVWTSNDIDMWWKEREYGMLESLIYSNVKNEEVVTANQIAPWIVPAMRGKAIYNTEHLKGKKRNESSMVQGCPKKLATAIKNGDCNPL